MYMCYMHKQQFDNEGIMLWFLSCSVKFMDKIRYVYSLDELSQIVPMVHVQIPDCVLQ